MANNAYFVVVGSRDNPMYEAEFGPMSRPNQENKKEDHRHLNQFVVHAAIDVVDELMWTTNSMYLKTVDKFNEWYISAYVCASNVKLMLLHDTRNEDAIKNFFVDVHELYLKILMNPFHNSDDTIDSKNFDSKVRQLAKKYLS